ncbi:MAG: alpha/beta hydrolase [Acidobacteriota bacterium]
MTSAALKTLIELLREQRAPVDASWEQRRADMEERQRELELPDDVVCAPVEAHGVPCEWIHCGDERERVVLYLHGGGYTLGSIATHRHLIQRIARACGGHALAVEYRLAPEHPHPAAVDDSTAACRWLFEQGVDPQSVVVAGDSAGGGLAAATLLALRDSGGPTAAGGVLLSPWTDLTGSGESLRTKADEDPMVTAEGLTAMAAAYAPGRCGDPLASPYFGELGGLPPLLIQVGSAEILLDDSIRLAERAKAAEVPVDLEVWDEMIHVFQAFPMLDESERAIENIGSWVRQHT